MPIFINLFSRLLTFHKLLKPFGHCLPVGSSPVDTVTARALHILVLGLENVRRHPVFYLRFTPLQQGLIAFQADSKWPEMTIKI